MNRQWISLEGKVQTNEEKKNAKSVIVLFQILYISDFNQHIYQYFSKRINSEHSNERNFILKLISLPNAEV